MADELTRGQRAAQSRREREARELEQAERLGRAEARAETLEQRASSPSRSSSSSAPSAGDVAGDAGEAAAGAFAGNRASKVQARKLVLVMILLLFALNIYHEQRGDTKVGFYRRLWATGVVGIMLTLLADFAPGVAGPLALIVVLSQVPAKGNSLLVSQLDKIGATTKPAARSSGVVPSPVPGTIPGAGGELRPPGK